MYHIWLISVARKNKRFFKHFIISNGVFKKTALKILYTTIHIAVVRNKPQKLFLRNDIYFSLEYSLSKSKYPVNKKKMGTPSLPIVNIEITKILRSIENWTKVSAFNLNTVSVACVITTHIIAIILA